MVSTNATVASFTHTARGNTAPTIEACSGGAAFVPVMESRQVGDGDHATVCRRLNRPSLGGVLGQREMRDRLGEAGKGLEPKVIRAQSHSLRPPAIVKLPAPLNATLEALGLAPMMEMLSLGLDREAGERVLAYWPGVEIR
jgi:hypothetical protein